MKLEGRLFPQGSPQTIPDVYAHGRDTFKYGRSLEKKISRLPLGVLSSDKDYHLGKSIDCLRKTKNPLAEERDPLVVISALGIPREFAAEMWPPELSDY